MYDKFEQFIIENREALDQSGPSPRVWAGLEQRLDKQSRRGRVRYLTAYRAAAAVALVLLGLAIGVLLPGPQILSNQGTSEISATILPEFQETQQYYQTEIQQRLGMLASHPDAPVIKNDLRQLEKFYQELERELKTVPYSEKDQVIQAMIHNYQIRLGILEHVLDRIDSVEPNQNLNRHDNQKDIEI